MFEPCGVYYATNEALMTNPFCPDEKVSGLPT
jgi:hypothetical protein